MTVTIDAIFEQGVFRPLKPVGFDEGTQAVVTVCAATVGKRFADRVVLPEFSVLRSIAGDTTRQISADRNCQP